MSDAVFIGQQGAQGRQGMRGRPGTQGGRGATGSGAQGFQGAAGGAGAQGFQGAAGGAGAQGFQGAAGGAGAQGFQGAAGGAGAQGAQGWYGGDSLGWNYLTATGASDPGTGNLKFNNATPSSASTVYINNTATGSIAASSWLSNIQPGDRFHVKAVNDATIFLACVCLTSSPSSGYRTITFSQTAANGTFTNNLSVFVTVSPKGAQGAGGAQGAQGAQGAISSWGTEEPSDFTATMVSDTEIDLTWTENADFDSKYLIQRSTSPSGPFSDVTLTAVNAEAFSDTGLSSSTTYYYRLYGKYGPVLSAVKEANATTDAAPAAPFSGTWDRLADGGQAGHTDMVGLNSGYPDFSVNHLSNTAEDFTARFANVDVGWTVSVTDGSGTAVLTVDSIASQPDIQLTCSISDPGSYSNPGNDGNPVTLLFSPP